jgi:hypothetical protein
VDLSKLKNSSYWLRLQFQNGISDEKYFYRMLEKGVEYYGNSIIAELKEKRKATVECECCHRITAIPYFTPQALAQSYISVIRTRGGRIIYFCGNNCRRRHRGVLANVGIEFCPQDLIKLENKNEQY